MQKKILVLFDFDGTLSKGDSLWRFMWFSLSFYQLLFGSILLIFKYLGLIVSNSWNNEKGKEVLMSTFFKGCDETNLRVTGLAFYQRKFPGILHTATLARLREYRVANATVVLVSASMDIWLRPFCEAEGIDLLCTELAFESGKFSGHFATPNCNGPEKARRIREAYDLHAFDKIIAYGNSAGDAEMLAIADEAWIIRGLNHTFAPQIYKSST